MQDIRIERWAHTLVHYSLYLKAGETVAILATPLAAPLVEAVYREVLRVGAHPLPLIELENLEELLLCEGNDAQLTKTSPIAAALAEHIDARLTRRRSEIRADCAEIVFRHVGCNRRRALRYHVRRRADRKVRGPIIVREDVAGAVAKRAGGSAGKRESLARVYIVDDGAAGDRCAARSGVEVERDGLRQRRRR